MTRVYHHADELPAGLAFDRDWISAAAVEAAETLQAAGYDGYLVGGCVRDLLLNRRPKDFDITTDAGPEQIKSLFRRSRIIGRRFKLVHVRFGREIIEVATYRAKPGGRARRLSERGRVVDDNVFGSIEQDAARRDFTINALYFDPVGARLVDFLGGVKDAGRGILRMIGDPRERFTEDPVRMLRAARFRAKLGLALEDRLAPAIADCLDLLEDVPAARLYDETLKMFHHGHALAMWEELRNYDLARKLFPLSVDAVADPDAGRAAAELIRLGLENTDLRVGEGKPVIAAFLFAVLLWLPFRRELAARRQASPRLPLNEAVWVAVDAVFKKQSRRVAVPRRVSSAVGEIWGLQFELEQRRPRAVRRLLAERRFRAAFDFLLLRARLGEVKAELADWWTAMQAEGAVLPPPARPRRKKPAAADAAGASSSAV